MEDRPQGDDAERAEERVEDLEVAEEQSDAITGGLFREATGFDSESEVTEGR